MLYEIATDGYHPYERDSDGYILEDTPIRTGSLEKLDPNIKELLSKMLAPNPNVRPSLEELEKALPQIQSLVKISLK